jgi:2-keto-4-pentenoate hydratase/2-oxohepta-3-ene-1,7-dioic acid hydratase in catechol pathway
MAQLIDTWHGSGALAAQLSGAGLALADVALLAPLPRPGAIILVGKNYMDHVREMDAAPFGQLTRPAAPAAPIIFTKSPLSVIGTGASIVLPVGVSSQARPRCSGYARYISSADGHATSAGRLRG